MSGVVMQPLLFPAEDFLWSRSFWNCGKAPWLLPELQCDPKDWRFRSDVHLRKARWLY